MELLNAFTGTVRKCVDDYDMLQEGDGVAVGVSGGKDSLALLCALAHLRRYYPKPFRLEAVTLELGFPGMDFAPVAELCRRLGVPYTRKKTDIREIVFDIRKEENPCSLCAKLRRGGLNDVLKERGLNKLALGHHFDDAVETFLLSLLFEGRLSCFKPVTWMSRAEVWQIRPLVYSGEKRIARLAADLACRWWRIPAPRTRPASVRRSRTFWEASPSGTRISKARFSAPCSACPWRAGPRRPKTGRGGFDMDREN